MNDDIEVITVICGYCHRRFEIDEQDFEDWQILDPLSGDRMIMCSSCMLPRDVAATGF